MRSVRAEAKRLKRQMLEKPAQCCYVCRFAWLPILQLHHLEPVSEGGTNDNINLVLLCPNCHALLHAIQRAATTEEQIAICDQLGGEIEADALHRLVKLYAWANQWRATPQAERSAVRFRELAAVQS